MATREPNPKWLNGVDEGYFGDAGNNDTVISGYLLYHAMARSSRRSLMGQTHPLVAEETSSSERERGMQVSFGEVPMSPSRALYALFQAYS
jgi:hypothetical protein